eukprot:TRINITY_DN8550_c0_g1_i4.p1 TRINITY_DN8550_c0_g1~~TRINITY_DN8550_c0_g1_i4.p1  ORF type:complete len:118 (-),score=7.31 TRINITY_DN8550_c0_g1_i4:89-442(-)
MFTKANQADRSRFEESYMYLAALYEHNKQYREAMSVYETLYRQNQKNVVALQRFTQLSQIADHRIPIPGIPPPLEHPPLKLNLDNEVQQKQVQAVSVTPALMMAKNFFPGLNLYVNP